VCFPISPVNQETISKNDQLIKILQRINLDPQYDLSFLSNADEEEYCKEAMNIAGKHPAKKLQEVFSKSDPELMDILHSMLNMNPYLRPTADQLLKRKIFDDIRVPMNEVKAPHKIQISIDKNELKFDYEEEKMAIDEKTAIVHFRKLIIKEALKFKPSSNKVE
jgi:serine/threonine protein kinase